MILRRVIQHVRKQEWTAIGIDLVIVVVGVYKGIGPGRSSLQGNWRLTHLCWSNRRSVDDRGTIINRASSVDADLD